MKIRLNASRWVAGASLLTATQLGVAGTIAGSAHDFTTAAWSGGRICVACHTPHNSNTSVSVAPLWNHRNSTATYTLYTSPTLRASVGQPGGLSKLCLSCHDGTVAVDSFGATTGTTTISAESNVGTALNNDHPVGFTYNTALATANGSLFDPASKSVTVGSGGQTKSGTIAATILYGGQMECSSCHDVHNTFTVGGSGLLKISASSSAICMACHNK